MDENIKAVLIQLLEEGIPFHKYLGFKVDVLEQDFIRVTIPFKDDFIGDMRKKRWHGGIIASIMDGVGGGIGIANFKSTEDRLSTIDLRIDYLQGAKDEPLSFEGELVRMGNRIMVAKMKAFQGAILVAEGKGVYNFIRAEH